MVTTMFRTWAIFFTTLGIGLACMLPAWGRDEAGSEGPRSWKERVVLRGATNAVTCVAFSKDGRTLAAGSKDSSIMLWDVPTNKLQTTLSSDGQEVTCVAFSPDGKILASGSYGFMMLGNNPFKGKYTGTAKLW